MGLYHSIVEETFHITRDAATTYQFNRYREKSSANTRYLSTIVSENASWRGNPPLVREENRSGPVCVTRLSMGLHTGTHIDFPYHISHDGKRLDAYPLDRFVGMVRVLRITRSSSIEVDELKIKNFEYVVVVIFETCYSTLWLHNEFNAGFIRLKSEAVQYLVDC
jgi:arylformamidase